MKNLWLVPRLFAAAAVLFAVLAAVFGVVYGWQVGTVYLLIALVCGWACRDQARRLRRHRTRMRVLRWSSGLSDVNRDLEAAVKSAPVVNESVIDELWREDDDANVVRLRTVKDRGGAA